MVGLRYNIRCETKISANSDSWPEYKRMVKDECGPSCLMHTKYLFGSVTELPRRMLGLYTSQFLDETEKRFNAHFQTRSVVRYYWATPLTMMYDKFRKW